MLYAVCLQSAVRGFLLKKYCTKLRSIKRLAVGIAFNPQATAAAGRRNNHPHLRNLPLYYYQVTDTWAPQT
jgi:hypothetical protein